MIYRWYKILSPHIDLAVDGVGKCMSLVGITSAMVDENTAFDEQNLRLYVSLHQNFKLWVVPFYNAPVKLVTVLQLTTDPMATPLEHRETSDLLPAESDKDKVKAGNGNRTVDRSVRNHEKQKAQQNSSGSTVSSKEHNNGEPEKVKYYIQSQNDLYQTTEWIKFLVPWGIGVLLMVTWQFYATFLCVVGTKVYDLLMWVPTKLYHQHIEVFDNDNKEHPHLGAD